ncbi:MAG: hypothetical protein WD673_01480, partial [Alphaproteobacteria bacterium]
ALGARAVALYTGADRLLDAAAQLAGGLGVRLDVLALAPDQNGAEALRRRIEDWRARSGSAVTVTALATGDVASIARAIEQGG